MEPSMNSMNRPNGSQRPHNCNPSTPESFVSAQSRIQGASHRQSNQTRQHGDQHGSGTPGRFRGPSNSRHSASVLPSLRPPMYQEPCSGEQGHPDHTEFSPPESHAGYRLEGRAQPECDPVGAFNASRHQTGVQQRSHRPHEGQMVQETHGRLATESLQSHPYRRPARANSARSVPDNRARCSNAPEPEDRVDARHAGPLLAPPRQALRMYAPTLSRSPIDRIYRNARVQDSQDPMLDGDLDVLNCFRHGGVPNNPIQAITCQNRELRFVEMIANAEGADAYVRSLGVGAVVDVVFATLYGNDCDAVDQAVLLYQSRLQALLTRQERYEVVTREEIPNEYTRFFALQVEARRALLTTSTGPGVLFVLYIRVR
ncbi:hypothetical protein QBC41DRAFT_303629 [Cercophora samala]|uniref:Uncharacterized protein n=1 Tax=Cercophora samala TaxID=330535 RepID=A0AA39ZCY3_9PEZI|nr:hypothetical protein QBC41DRAFT_303629 [Cercophora samala]